jgi:single-strand DNA-binding protein
MAGEPTSTIVGNVAGDPVLKFTGSGLAICSFTVAATPRVKEGDSWVDGETMWVRCSVFRQQAENAAESLVKGTRVLVHGRLKVRSWEKDGQTRTGIEMDVEHLGPELRYATATVNKVSRDGGGSSSNGGGSDAWASAAPASGDSEPPF